MYCLWPVTQHWKCDSIIILKSLCILRSINETLIQSGVENTDLSHKSITKLNKFCKRYSWIFWGQGRFDSVKLNKMKNIYFHQSNEYVINSFLQDRLQGTLYISRYRIIIYIIFVYDKKILRKFTWTAKRFSRCTVMKLSKFLFKIFLKLGQFLRCFIMQFYWARAWRIFNKL